MRISDWSSDVCSSDLPSFARGFAHRLRERDGDGDQHLRRVKDPARSKPAVCEIGAAREGRGTEKHAACNRPHIVRPVEFKAGPRAKTPWIVSTLLRKIDQAAQSLYTSHTAAHIAGDQIGISGDRQSVVSGKRWSVLVDLGGRQ